MSKAQEVKSTTLDFLAELEIYLDAINNLTSDLFEISDSKDEKTLARFDAYDIAREATIFKLKDQIMRFTNFIKYSKTHDEEEDGK